MIKRSVLFLFFIFTLPVLSAEFNLPEFDQLSVKLLTVDNLFVRLPDESQIELEAITLTRLSIRWTDILVGVDYKEGLKNSIHEEIKKTFDDDRIEIPFHP